MKKLIAVVVLLLVFSVGSFAGIGYTLETEKSEVLIRERVIYGDKSYADGVEVLVKSHFKNHLFWTTSCLLGETNNVATDYEFYAEPYYEEHGRSYQGIQLQADFVYGFNQHILPEECVGMQKAYRELFDETARGKEQEKYIRLQDYYTYYPIRVSFDLPGVLWQGNDYDTLYDEQENERAVWDRFNDFFRIPVPDDLPDVRISIGKDSYGNVNTVGASGLEHYWIDSCDVHTSNRVFFSISNRYTSKDGDAEPYVDTSLIPGGYGIYSLQYTDVRNAGNTQGNTTVFQPFYETGIDDSSLAMVFPLERHAAVKYLALSNDESKLYIFTAECDTTYLTVVDIATMTELQKLKITDADQYTVHVYDNCIVLNSWYNVSVVEKQDNGLCRLAFSVPRPTEIDTNYYHTQFGTSMAFDGKSLAMVGRLTEENYGAMELCGFTLAIYNETGLCYYGEYQSSLSMLPDPQEYAFNCFPLRHSVQWKK